MPEQIEKAYYFKENEFFLLLRLGGLSELYCFQSDVLEKIEYSNVVMALHQLIKCGYVQINNYVIISQEIQEIIKILQSANYAVNIVPLEENEQKICYLSNEGIVVTELTGQRKEIRVRKMELSVFEKFLYEGSDLKSPAFETKEECLDIEQLNNQMQQERKKYQDEEPLSLKQDLFMWMEKSGVLVAWEIQNLREKEILKRILFRRGLLGNWVIEQTAQGVELGCDCEEFRMEMAQWLNCCAKGE